MGPEGGKLMRLINLENIGKKDLDPDPHFNDWEKEFLG